MKFYIKHRTKSELQVGLLYGIIGSVGFMLAQVVDKLPRLIPPCLFHGITGIPCPACGATRTGIMLSRFRVIDALGVNPLFFFVFGALAFWGINSFIGLLVGKNCVIELKNKEQRMLRVVILMAIPLNWLYLILTHK